MQLNLIEEFKEANLLRKEKTAHNTLIKSNGIPRVGSPSNKFLNHMNPKLLTFL